MTKRHLMVTAVTVAAMMTGLASGEARGQVIFSQFNFNNGTNGASLTSSSASSGTGTFSLVGTGVTATYAAGSPRDTASPNQAANVTGIASTAPSGSAGAQVSTSTIGSTAPIQIQFDFRQSGTASRYFQLQASSDGSTFTNVSGGTAAFGSTGTGTQNTNTSFSSTGLYSNNSGSGTQQFVQQLTYTFAAGSTYENNPNFAFRFVAVYDPTTGTSYTGSNGAFASTGTNRFDLVTVGTGLPVPVPEPATVLAAGSAALAGVGALRRCRKLAPAVA